MAITPINGYENYNYFTPKPVDERRAGSVNNPNFFVNPPTGYTEYVPQNLFEGNTVGLSGLVANSSDGHIVQGLPAQAGYAAGTTTRSFIA